MINRCYVEIHVPSPLVCTTQWTSSKFWNFVDEWRLVRGSYWVISQPKIPRPLERRENENDKRLSRHYRRGAPSWEPRRGQSRKWCPRARWRSDPGCLNLIYTSFLSFTRGKKERERVHITRQFLSSTGNRASNQRFNQTLHFAIIAWNGIRRIGCDRVGRASRSLSLFLFLYPFQSDLIHHTRLTPLRGLHDLPLSNNSVLLIGGSSLIAPRDFIRRSFRGENSVHALKSIISPEHTHTQSPIK